MTITLEVRTNDGPSDVLADEIGDALEAFAKVVADLEGVEGIATTLRYKP